MIGSSNSRMYKTENAKYVVALLFGLGLTYLLEIGKNAVSNMNLFEIIAKVVIFFNNVEQVIITAFTG